jgi:serine/threonine protein phosphatase PrpC
MNLEIDGFIDKETKLFVVADGHGFNGHYVSAVIKQRLPELILQNISSPETIF